VNQVAKRVGGLAVGFALTLSALAGCGAKPVESEPQKAPAPAAATRKKVGFSQGDYKNSWHKAMRADMEKAAKDNGYDIVILDAQSKAPKQMADIEDLLAQKVDLIVVQTYVAQAIGPAVDKIKAAKVPVVVLSSDIPGVTPDAYFSTDSLETGRAVANLVLSKRKDPKILHITGTEGSVVNNLRGQGFHEVLQKNGIKELVEVSGEYDRSKAIKVMEDLLQRHRGKFDVVFCHNDDMAHGVLQVLKENNIPLYPKDPNGVMVLGVDGLTDETAAAIKAGEFFATFKYPTFATEAGPLIAKMLKGDKGPGTVTVNSPAITRENVDQFQWVSTKG